MNKTLKRGDSGGEAGHASARRRAGILLIVTATLFAMPLWEGTVPNALADAVRGPAAVSRVCQRPHGGAVGCDSLLLRDSTQWQGLVPPLPAVDQILGLVTGATTTTTATAAPTTSTSVASTTSTTQPPSHRGYGPADLQSAYRLPSTSAGAGHTVAVVDPYDDPNAEADLGVYRSFYGLPPCTTASGCFRKIDQRGGNTYPAPDANWAQEISLDLDMVSASCPNCHIALVEADSDGLDDVAAAENAAAASGPDAIANSFSVAESALAAVPDDSAYRHPGIAITAAAGNSGYGAAFPSDVPSVTAVGGTTLTRDSSARGWSESAFAKAGSGCSGFYAKPPWQQDTGCDHRTAVDVAAVADPKTGVAVYDSIPDSTGHSGWMVFGGTSVGAPLVAGAFALAGNAGTAGPDFPYQHPEAFNDITSGNNGTCSPQYLCTAGPGYDGPTGLGTPSGVAGL